MIRIFAMLTITLLMVSGALADAPASPGSAVSALRLRPSATVRGEVVRLADIIVAEGVDALIRQRLADKLVATKLSPPADFEVSHERAVTLLSEMGLNLARVSLVGAATCRVNVQPDVMPETEALPETQIEAAPLFRTPPADPAAATTLASRIRDMIAAEFGDKGQPEVMFESAAEEFLSLDTPFEFAIRPMRGPTLGAREFSVTIRRDGRTQRTVRIAAQVKLLRQVTVAARPINVGTYIRRDALTTALREFGADADLGFSGTDGLIGQQAARFIAAGDIVETTSVKNVDLVKRSQPVTVEGGEGVRLRITGVALDSGKLGDSVRIRLGDSRKSRREVRGVVTSVGVVRLTEEPA